MNYFLKDVRRYGVLHASWVWSGTFAKWLWIKFLGGVQGFVLGAIAGVWGCFALAFVVCVIARVDFREVEDLHDMAQGWLAVAVGLFGAFLGAMLADD